MVICEMQINSRLVQLFRQLAGNPTASTPPLVGCWGDTAAAYQLRDNER